MLTDKNGSDVGQFLYSPFGEMWIEEASTVNIDHITRFFTNQQYDKESGLYYYNARYYDPHLGSFITPDPAMDGLNHYAYCNANPINYTDPSGMFTVDWSSWEPGHWGDVICDGKNGTDYMESQYGAVGFGTGGTTDTGSSSSSSSDYIYPYYDHPRSEPYVPINTPAVNNAGSNNNYYSPAGTNSLPSISYNNVPIRNQPGTYDRNVNYLSQVVDGIKKFPEDCKYFAPINAALGKGLTPIVQTDNLAEYVHNYVSGKGYEVSYVDLFSKIFGIDNVFPNEISKGLTQTELLNLIGDNPAILIYNLADFWAIERSGSHGIGFYNGNFNEPFFGEWGSFNSIKDENSVLSSTSYLKGYYFTW